MIDLINKLNDATRAYDEGHPIMSDAQWDDMYFWLEDLEKSTGIVYPNSPTQKVQFYSVQSGLPKVKHNHPMLSLAKTKSLSEIEDFCGNEEVIFMAKMDGLTCSLTYENGKLIGAETRGNGEIGEDILHNAQHIKNLPQHIPTDKRVVIDGEVICTYKDFEPFKNDYRNPRNFAAGSIRLLDSEESAARNLSFIAWDGIEGFDETLLNEKLDKIALLGFDIVPWVIENPKYAINDIQDYCNTHSYPIDGVVAKYNNCEKYEACGRTDHHFKGGIAFKFYDDLYETNLLNIEWSMGKTGVLTPIAVFEPVDAEGSIVERASLHNLSLINDIFVDPPCYGQHIRIYKANQIIPQVYDAQPPSLDMKPIVYPDVCPCCGEKVSYRYDGVSEYCFCDNPNCAGRLINRLDHFFGKKGLDVKGLSKATFEKLIDWGWVNSIYDVYTVMDKHMTEWMKKPGFGPKSVTNIYDAIQTGKNCKLSQFISALGIPLVGTKYAKIIASKFLDWTDFRQATDTDFDFTDWDGFGPEINTSLHNFDYSEADILVKIIHISSEYSKTVTNYLSALDDKTFVITGRLNHYKNRDELVKIIEDNGGKVVSSISKNTSFLINNDINSTSAKNKAAKQLNIPIITEEEFEQYLQAHLV